MKILVNCYACSPYKGSEPGMGWNFVKCLSKYHELHIITESKFQEDLDKYFNENPEEKRNYNFYFLKRERHNLLRKIYPPSYYWFYKKWQKKVLIFSQELDKHYHFDIIHQLNMIGYREPGYLYKLNKPFVWGPIGGFNITPWSLLSSMGIYGCIFYFCRNIINLYQMHNSKRIRTAINSSNILISATKDDHDKILKLWNKKSIIIPEVGFTSQENNILPRKRNGNLKICWSGLHIPRKSLNLLLEAIPLCKNKENIELHIIGDGECNSKWKKMAKRLQINNIKWYGWVDRETAMNIMQQSHIFTITSLSDATSTVLLEALSLGLPVIALNHLGFANVITDNCGIKIDIKSKAQLINNLSKAIDNIYENEDLRLHLANGAINRSKEFSWESKAKIINNIYLQISK
ncbi:glycosyltransferase family 4 protein [Phocaeicola plebeius]|uniref:glycosyltransferase family 4 protein n=1 Tax=Phocaeicola plebeius TaxID=310297 RepID=UPI000E4EE5FC|nr:glycosyltransferase family 4 protein [Phocaeicola plebeius]RHA25037.1 glycosyltransferase [Phocaeicola plebeius]RHA27802.1 glycosyltransferase [Phocaeicola plebeius]